MPALSRLPLILTAAPKRAYVADVHKSGGALQAEKAMVTVQDDDAQGLAKVRTGMTQLDDQMRRTCVPHARPNLKMPASLSGALQHCVGGCASSSVQADIGRALSSGRAAMQPLLAKAPDSSGRAMAPSPTQA